MANINKYVKTLVLKTTDGQVTLTGEKARAVQKRLDDNKDIVAINDENGVITYYNINPIAGVPTKVAVVTPSKEEVAETACKESL